MIGGDKIFCGGKKMKKFLVFIFSATKETRNSRIAQGLSAMRKFLLAALIFSASAAVFAASDRTAEPWNAEPSTSSVIELYSEVDPVKSDTDKGNSDVSDAFVEVSENTKNNIEKGVKPKREKAGIGYYWDICQIINLPGCDDGNDNKDKKIVEDK